MRYVLVHSPLVSAETWHLLEPELSALGQSTVTPSLSNAGPHQDNGSLHHQHATQVINSLERGDTVVLHSGAGTIAAGISKAARAPADLRLVFLDAIVPVLGMSRFDLFGDPQSVASWRALAQDNDGLIPKAAIARMCQSVQDDAARARLVRTLADVPIEIYEEPVDDFAELNSASVYVQWTAAYDQDAQRAAQLGMQVMRQPASHFAMLNDAGAVAGMLVALADA